MADDPPHNSAPRRLKLRGQRHDESARPFEVTIQTNRFGGVEVSVAAARGKRSNTLIVDCADVDALCAALRAAALEAGDRLFETVAAASASAVIYNAQQAAIRT